MSVGSLSKYKQCINKLQQQQQWERKPPLSHLCSPSLLLSLLVHLYPPLSGDALPWAKRRISHGALPATWRALTISTFSAFALRWRELVFRPALPQGLIQLHFLSEHFKMPVLPLLSFLLVFLSATKWLDCIFLFNTITQKRRGTSWCWRLGCTVTAKLKFSCSDISCLGFLTHPPRSVSVVRNHHLQSTAAQPGSVSVLTKVVWVQKGNLCGVTEVKQQFSGIKQKP